MGCEAQVHLELELHLICSGLFPLRVQPQTESLPVLTVERDTTL